MCLAKQIERLLVGCAAAVLVLETTLHGPDIGDAFGLASDAVLRVRLKRCGQVVELYRVTVIANSPSGAEECLV